MYKFNSGDVVRYIGKHIPGGWTTNLLNKLFMVVDIDDHDVVAISCYKEKNQIYNNCCRQNYCHIVYSNNIEKLTLKNICRTL